MKKYELINLYKDKNGYYTAVIYNRLGGYFKEKSFLYYTKKEVLSKLRNEHDCIIKRGF